VPSNPGSDNERLLATFLDLVRIYSPSGAEGACAAYCADMLSASGCAVSFDESMSVTGSDTGNLIAVLPGTGPGTLVLSAHLDVVEPCSAIEPVLSEGRIHSAGDTVLGSDDKSGLAAAIECVRRLAESSEPHPAVKCVFTVKEEVGLIGAKQLRADHVEGDLCLVLDAAGAPGGIVVAAPTHYTFVAEFSGRAAHAGVEPEKGVSAIAMAAHAVCGMPFGRIDESSTANVGSIEGSGPTNVVAPSARLAGECRSLDRQKVEAIRSSMHTVMEDSAATFGGTVDLSWTLEYEGFALAPDASAVGIVSAACRRIGIPPTTFSTGGGSDANVIAALGVPTVALSCGMTGVHGTQEEIAVADLETLTEICVAVARQLTV
jgi:tripeptide aminopeptidase